MTRFTLRRSLLPLVLLALLVANGVRYWTSQRSAAQQPLSFPGGGPGDIPPPDAAMQERMAAALKNLPPDQRQAAEERFAADRAFFESVRTLPAEQRRQKMQEHFAQNPPPPGFGPGLPPPGGPPPGSAGDPTPGGPEGPGGPGEGGRNPRIPEPSVRRSMDAQIAKSQKSTAP